MTAPTPNEVRREGRKLVKSLGELVAEYSWAYSWAHSVDRRRRDLDSTGKNVGDPADPTGDIASHKLKKLARRVMQETFDEIAEARMDLISATKRLSHLIPEERPEPEMLMPKILRDSELAESRRKQAERHARGDGFGAN